ncbi:hypothetical protein DFJ74DRAFT_745611 [Hyaloraphidium curvatum]|nr:hypothetical protein DFJ74DRAFT_745611 [Hyaloraphidium curvatum]
MLARGMACPRAFDTPPRTELSGAPPAADPTGGLRDERPLTRAALMRELAGLPLLRNLLRLQAATVPLAPWLVFRHFLLHGSSIAVSFSTILVFNDGRFGTRQLVGGFIAEVVLALGFTTIVLFGASFRNVIASAASAVSAGREMSWHYSAAIARWLQASRVAEKEATGANLVGHIEDDPLCPCARPDCAGGAPQAAARLHLLEVVWRSVLGATMTFLFGYTSFVTFGAQFIGTWWGILLTVVQIISVVTFYPVNNFLRYAGNVASLNLSRRLIDRGMRLALSNFLLRYRTALLGTPKDASPADLNGTEPYQILHDVITRSWPTRYRVLGATAGFITTAVLGTIVNAVINIASGSCVPVYALGGAVFSANQIVVDLVNMSVMNGQLDDLSKLYAEARREIGELVVAAMPLRGADGDGLRAAAVEGLLAHDRVIAAFQGVQGSKMRLAGFVIGYGTLRTLVVTSATLALGLWTILRAAGIGFTMEVVCPTVS